MSINAFLKNTTEFDYDLTDLWITVSVGYLYDLSGKLETQIRCSSELTTAINSGDLQLIAPNEVTIYPISTAIAIINGADPASPFISESVIRPQDFRWRFTFAERKTITNSTDEDVKTLVDDLRNTDHIDLENQVTIDGMDLLVTKGIITTTRKNEILAY